MIAGHCGSPTCTGKWVFPSQRRAKGTREEGLTFGRRGAVVMLKEGKHREKLGVALKGNICLVKSYAGQHHGHK